MPARLLSRLGRRLQVLRSDASKVVAPAETDGPLPERRLAFLHFFKAGGTTVRQAAGLTLDKTLMFPVQQQGDGAEVAAAGTYRFVSGHFVIGFIDDLVAHHGFLAAVQLRDPVERLRSAYNFWRAHAIAQHPALQDRQSEFSARVDATKRLSPGDFFRTARFTMNEGLDNHYAWTLSGHAFDTAESARQAALAAALDRLERFDFVGTTTNALATVNYVRDVFGAPRFAAFAPVKETEAEMRIHPWMEPVSLATRADVEEAVEPLVRLDAELYARACALNAVHAARPSTVGSA